MRISIRKFEGIRPLRAIHLLAYNEAQVAQNTKIRNEELRPFFAEKLEATLFDSGLVRTIFYYLSQYWLSWPATVDVALGPVANDVENRFYYTGDGIPKKSNEAEATTGAGSMPINFYPIAIPPAKYAPTLFNAGGGAGDSRETAYVWTNVTEWGEESGPSPVSALITTQNGDQVDLSGMTNEWQAGTQYTTEDFIVPTVANGFFYKCVVAGTSGGVEPAWGTVVDQDTADNTVVWRAYENILATKRIYRIIASEVAAVYLFVDEIDATLTTYSDTKLDSQLGEQLRTGFGDFAAWTNPPDGLTNLVVMPNGIMAGSVGKDIYFSEPFQPHAWPLEYILTLDSTVVALGVMENNLVAATDLNPYIITGTTPESMTPIKMPDFLPCVSKRSLVEFWRGVLYATNVGLVLVSEGRADNVTKQHYSKEEWQQLFPDTMTGEYHDGKYFAFYSEDKFEGKALVVDLERNDVFMLDLGDLENTFYATATHVDKRTDTLYLLRQTADVLLHEDGTPYPSRSGVVLLEDGGTVILENPLI